MAAATELRLRGAGTQALGSAAIGALALSARWGFTGLFVAIAVAFVLPPESLLFDPPWLRYLVAAAVAFAPVFLANIVFTPELPKTRSGKIMRRLLRDVAENRELGDTTTLADPTVVEEIKTRATTETREE